MHSSESTFEPGGVDPRETGNPADLRDIDSVVKHLDEAVGAYLKLGLSSKLLLTREQFLQVVEWAKMVSREETVSPPEKTELDFFMSGLLEEMMQIPSNIFEEVEFPDGKTRYMPIRPEVWEAGLDHFEAKFLATLKCRESPSGEMMDASFFQPN